ncbi:hypothetical protein Tco_1483021 [Tanacetum coccineum]
MMTKAMSLRMSRRMMVSIRRSSTVKLRSSSQALLMFIEQSYDEEIDEVFPAEEQPLPAALSPITDSPGYIADSDPEEDPTDYPADRGDDDDDEDESSDDDEDDVDIGEDEGGGGVPSSCRTLTVVAFIDFVFARISIRPQTPVLLPSDTEVARLLAIPTPPPSPLSPWSSPLP